VINQRIDYSDQ